MHISLLKWPHLFSRTSSLDPSENTGVCSSMPKGWPRGSCLLKCHLGLLTGVALQVNTMPCALGRSWGHLLVSCCCCKKLSQMYPLTFLEARSPKWVSASYSPRASRAVLLSGGFRGESLYLPFLTFRGTHVSRLVAPSLRLQSQQSCDSTLCFCHHIFSD